MALSDLTRLTTQLINSTLNTEGTPDPRVQALVQSLNGRLSLVKQQLLIQNASQQSDAARRGVARRRDRRRGRGPGPPRRSTSVVAGIGELTAANGTRLGQATTARPATSSRRRKMFATYDGLSTRLLTGIDEQLAANASSSKSRALTDAAIILLALAGLAAAGAVRRPCADRARCARCAPAPSRWRHEKLPETVAAIRNGQEPEEITPIPVHSHEELGQLARAVDDMHKQAVTLATGEAQLRSQVGAMFVTLSRRNTTLVNQQLALIESLEQDEEDPQRLEQLFSLDHLATRMRRTAETLVILGGAPGRHGRLRGAQRLGRDPRRGLRGPGLPARAHRRGPRPDDRRAARPSDVVHLMAELIDNALSYSPPGSPVTIQAAEDDGKVEIEIIDNGLGMAGDALAQANDSLKSGGEVTIDTARRMGLFVVSRLAEEHGLKVKLRRNTNGGGIIASIFLPHRGPGLRRPGRARLRPGRTRVELEEPVAPVVVEEPDEEYDPYLERIEEAIAAVTGLPRRRPGQAPGPATEVPAAPSACSTPRQPRAARRASSRPSCRAWRRRPPRRGRRAGAGRWPSRRRPRTATTTRSPPRTRSARRDRHAGLRRRAVTRRRPSRSTTRRPRSTSPSEQHEPHRRARPSSSESAELEPVEPGSEPAEAERPVDEAAR